MTRAPAVTASDPTIIGHRPKSFSEGYQLDPARKALEAVAEHDRHALADDERR